MHDQSTFLFYVLFVVNGAGVKILIWSNLLFYGAKTSWSLNLGIISSDIVVLGIFRLLKNEATYSNTLV